MLYAITINENHCIYDLDIQTVVNKLVQFSHTTYVDIVHHRETHYHALIDKIYARPRCNKQHNIWRTNIL